MQPWVRDIKIAQLLKTRYDSFNVMSGLFAWILMGLLAGVLGKFLLPGRDPGGLIMTIIIGILGAIVGGWIGTKANIGTVNDFSLQSIGIATGGSILLLVLYRMFTKK